MTTTNVQQLSLSRRGFVKAAATAATTATALGVASAGSSLLVGCGGGGADAGTGAAGAGAGSDTAAGGQRILKLSLIGEPSTLDPNNSFDSNSARTMSNITAGLFRLAAGGVVEPDLVERYERSDDGLVYTFKLKESTWSNDTPLTAHDFEYSWKRLADPANAFGNSQNLVAGGILNAPAIIAGEAPVDSLGVKALDDLTLEVTLDRPVSYLERVLRNTSLRPINQAFLEEHGASWGTSPETHLSNGPFKLSVYQPAAPTIEFVKNPNYHNAAEIPFDGLRIQVITDAQQALLAYQNNDLDVLELKGEQVQLFENDPTFYRELRPQLNYISPNTRIKGFEAPKLRKAFALAIDNDYLVENIINDGSIAAQYFVPWNFAFDSKGQDFREVAGTYQAVDREEAARLWEEVKVELGVGELSFQVLTGEDTQTMNVAQYVQAQIQDTLPGIHLELNPVPDKVWWDELDKGEYGFEITWVWGEYPDAVAYLMMYDSKTDLNYSAYGNEEYDRLIHDADRLPLAADEAGRIQALVRAEKIILDEDIALIPLFQSAQGYLTNPDLDVPFADGLWVVEGIRYK